MARMVGSAASVLMFATMLSACSGDDRDPAPQESATVADSSPQPSQAATPQDAELAKAERIVKDQFLPDQVDHSGSTSYQKEWWMIKGAVRQAGYPCAAVAFVQQQLDGTFKAVCKVKLHTNKFAAFIVNPDAESVEPIQP